MLNFTKLNSEYGGSQQDMHPTNIKHNYGYLGTHDQIIEMGDEHHIKFQGGINGPLCMTTQERVSTKCSDYDDM